MKILIVEDDLFFQKFYSNKLIEGGFEVEVASDGNEGLEKLKNTKPNLMLLDLIMPNKDGFEVLEEVSKDVELKKTPIIVFSTLGDEADVKKAMQLGARDYINKSLHDVANLKTKINAQLGVVPTAAQPAAVQQPIPQPAPQQPVVNTPQPNGNNTRTT
jgi:DNA-binding response OmpR family regulator